MKALKSRANRAEFKSLRAFYREDDPSYGNDVYRVGGNETNVGFYSFVYRKNNSVYPSNECLKLNLTGLHPVGEHDYDFFEIPSGGDHIFVMRCDQAFGNTGYGMAMG